MLYPLSYGGVRLVGQRPDPAEVWSLAPPRHVMAQPPRAVASGNETNLRPDVHFWPTGVQTDRMWWIWSRLRGLAALSDARTTAQPESGTP